ncbi:penicillin acylase family protein [Candidatus Amarolinea dominans]|uniref:penicillin acylase family protein n=1 Tax=Candidatus Amarolinea dominans TaxID=3140696 RepID=UPI0031374D3E|nr:penicillin acylase family protein [Anaerolineae bacterium]
MSPQRPFIGRVLAGGLTWLGRRRLAPINGTLSLPGLTAPVEIIRDRWGVPHIYAANDHDVFFAQGFVHAQDRLWQMELNRRLATGRLSEMLGDLALDTDRATRTFGFERLGRADWELLPAEDRQRIEAYCAGINAWLDSPAGKRCRPLEFTLLRHRPQPWRVEDTLAFSRVMNWQMSHAWYGEVIRAQLIAALGPERAAELEISDAADNPAVLPAGIEFNALAGAALAGAHDPFLKRRMGSNAWAISGSRSASGHPILCNDMHLQLTVPGIWHQVHLEAGDLRVTGVSVPGLPGVVAGHNAHIAWGITLAFTDCEDLFVEKFDPDQPRRYEFKGQWLDAEVIRETIQVKGRREPHVEEVLVTRHGPVISDVIGQPGQRLAVSSMALRPCPALHGWFALNRARNWDEFVEAMRPIEAPQLNFAYADVDGNIGYWVTGKVPIRARGQGVVPAPGWTGEDEWIGEVPFEEMPHALNPAAGYLVHCNNRIAPDDYPHYLGNAWMNGYRARRLADLLVSNDRVTAADCRAMQMDVTCLPGLEFVRLLAETFPQANRGGEAGDVARALDLLTAWDGRLSTDSVGGSLYEVTRTALVRALFAPIMGESLTTRWRGQGFHPVLMCTHEFYGHDTVVLLRMLRDPDSWWVAQAGGREALLRRGLTEAVAWLTAELGPEPQGWQWGRLHHIALPHALGVQKPLDLVFNRGPLPIGGDTDTPLQTATLPGAAFANDAWAPSMRHIIDMGDLEGAVAVLPVGQSGHLGSPHYDDLLELWSRGEYHPMLWSRAQVEKHAEAKLTLARGG